jgi:hypothetical protein
MKENQTLVSIGLIAAGLYVYFNPKPFSWPTWPSKEAYVETGVPLGKPVLETEETGVPLGKPALAQKRMVPELEKQPLTEPISTVIETPHEATIIPEPSSSSVPEPSSSSVPEEKGYRGVDIIVKKKGRTEINSQIN